MPTSRAKWRAAIAATLAVAISFSSTAVAQISLLSSCSRSPETVPTDVHCDVRLTEPRELGTVTARMPDGRPLQGRYEPFNFKLRSSSWLFLIQKTSHPRDGAREVERLLRQEGKRGFAVYGFAEQVEELARFGASERELKERLGLIGNRTGGKTALYTSAREGISRLAEHVAERRALVLVADGKTDRDAYAERDVIELAKQNNIQIFVIALTDREDRNLSQNLQALRRLADQTGGVLFDGGSERKLSSEAAARFHDYLENGGLLKLASADVPDNAEIEVAANVVGGSGLTVKSVVRSGPSVPNVQPPLQERVLDWLYANALVATVGAGLVAAGLAGLVLLSMPRRAPPLLPATLVEPSEEDLTARRGPTVGAASAAPTLILKQDRPPDHIYGWLQFLDAQSTKVPIGSTSVRIGRHEDNDICLPNKSVHRQHAVIHMGSDRTFVVRDLGGQNGVIVNSKKIDQRQLTDGDVIEFGEVRARFLVNRDALH